jgi:SAM-dependent methyltransferase
LECSQEGLEKLFRGPLAEAFAELMVSLWDRVRGEADAVRAIPERHGVGPGARLLELGAGVGRVAAHLASMGYVVDGVEYSSFFVEYGRRLLRKHGVEGRVRLLCGDAYKLDDIVGDERYDAVYMVWSTLLGYGLDWECDRRLLENARQHVKPSGLPVIANIVSYDRISFIRACGCRGPFITFTEHYAIIEEPHFDPLTQIFTNRWIICRKENKDLKYIGEAHFKLYIYTLRELAELATEAGWHLLAAYHDPLRGSFYN